MERSFKDLAREFSHYGSLDFIELSYSGHHQPGKKDIARVRQNWIWLVQQHASKANFMCAGVLRMPVDKEVVSQSRIFAAQLVKYLEDEGRIAILNGFPLFLFEYFKISFWH